MSTVYDNSQLQAYKDCPERYRLKYVEQIQKRQTGEEDHDRNFGKAIHAALEVLYKARQAGRPLLKADYHAAFEKEYPVSLKEEDLAKTPESGILLLDAYLNRYNQEDNQFEVLAVEVADEFELAPGIRFIVKIDMVIRQQGCIYFMDHKTTGKSFGYSYWNQFSPNSQITGYTAYCIAKYGECSGGIINALRFGHRQRAYKGEPAGFYQDFQRQIINRNRQQVEAWKLDQIEWINRVDADKNLILPGLSWNKNEAQCGYCQFREVCISCNDDQVKEQLYEKHDAREYLGGKELSS